MSDVAPLLSPRCSERELGGAPPTHAGSARASRPPCPPWGSTGPACPVDDEEELPAMELTAAALSAPSCTRCARCSLARALARAMLASPEALE
eukprot:4386047-Alexandrium_andersonii.AAC.1